tara:strand:- start:1730 stop:2221 length:492 start_codon:yes stop_codon:yes gene_type:complete
MVVNGGMTQQGATVPTQPFDNDARRQWLERKLDAADIPATGRVVRLVETTGLSRPTVTTIVRGGLPRDVAVCFQFAETFGLDVHEWVLGEARPDQLLEQAITMVRAFEQGRFGGEALTNAQFTELVLLVKRDPGRLERFMEDYSTFVERPASRGIFESDEGAA